MIDRSGWYDGSPDYTYYHQGDIVREVPFPLWPTFAPQTNENKWPVLVPTRPVPNRGQVDLLRSLPVNLKAVARREAGDAFVAGAGELIPAKVEMRTVMVISRSCSLDSHKKHLLVAPVEELSSLPLPEEEKKRVLRLADIRGNELFHYFYLPQSSMPESVVNLLMITYLHRSFLPDEEIRTKLIARLSPYGQFQLQSQLSKHLGQQFGFDHEDLCPQTGMYQCAHCFYSGGPVVQTERREGDPFGHCPQCGERAAFVKVNPR
jgi:hypothetical protein